MTLDFSSPEKIAAFLKTQEVSAWSQPIPNLKWITEAEFAHSHFFMFQPTHILLRKVAKDQLPEDFVPHMSPYARLILTDAVSGFVLLSEYARGRIHYGTFAFCEHRNQKATNLGRCYNRYDCLDCGHSWTIDSSD